MTERNFETRSGIPVTVYPNPVLHGFCLCLYVRAGSLYEAEADNGVTHCIEHMVFRNINRAMNGGLYPLIDRAGLTFNAETYKELVQFYWTGATAHFADAVRIAARLFDPVVLTGEDLVPEKDRVRSEIRESDERTSLDYFSDGIVWKNTPLSFPITGKSRTLNRMTAVYLKKAGQEIFTRPNVFFYVTGNVSETDIRFLCDTVSTPLPQGKFRDNTAPLPVDFCHRPRQIFLKNSPDTLVRYSFDFDPAGYTNAEILLLYDILFFGECGKIYRELSDRTGLIYSFDPCLERYRNAGVIHLKYEVQPGDLVRATELTVNVFRQLKDGIGEALNYVRPAYLDNAGLLLDDPDEFNWTRAYETKIMGFPYPDHEARAREFAAVSPDRIVQLAREIFRRDRLTFCMKGSRRKTDTEALEKILETLD